mmetsp:Transcript_7329/g.9273  ORF Transcript_7329/g.9273 Transcript_7329/m.9273 type:complete len:447 (-) Transcript_7329:4689-6029(-)
MKHPYQIITTDKTGKHLFATVKNHLQVFDLKSGSQLGSWVDDVDINTSLKKQQQEKIKALEAQQEELTQTSEDTELENESSYKKQKSNISKAIKVPKIPVPGPGAPPIYNYIRALSLSKDQKFLIGITDSDKSVIIFKIDFENTVNCLTLIKRQAFPKRPCAVSTSIDDKTVVVADKFGDVYTIDIDSEKSIDEKELSPLLGHVSMLSDVKIAEHNGKQFILTGDRDEHIRVSNYPKSYVVKHWLFGHREFVSSLHIPEFNTDLLISGGGDEFICLWNWYNNELLSKVPLRDLIQPFLSDSHLPPERFLKEDSVREISISKILTYVNPKSNDKLIVVLCENTKCLLLFELKDDFSITHKFTLKVDHSLIDICLDLSSGTFIASKDIESSHDLLEFYQLNNDTNTLEIVDRSGLSRAISEANNCEVQSRDQFYPLYYINSLRKRSEH